MYQKSLDINIKVHGCNHLVAANTVYNIAILHREQGQHDLEAECFDECAGIYAKVYRDDHNQTVDAQKQAAHAHATVVPN